MKAKEGHRYYDERTRLETVIPLSTPYILYVDPASICNLQCKFCPCGTAHKELWTTEKSKSIGIMDFDLYKKIIDDCMAFPGKIKVLRLYKEGEPLINPHFADMIAYAHATNKFIGIDTTTNGTLLNPELNRNIVNAGLTRIHISVEGFDGKAYKEICGKEIDFENFVANIKDLYDHKENCHIFIKTLTAETDEQINLEKKKRFYDIFGDICDEISFEHVSPCWPGFDKEMYSDTGIYGNKIQECTVCPRIFYILTINSDGAATQCIVDWNRKMLIGDVHNQTVPELWKAMRACQLEHLKGNRRKMIGCDECLEIETAAVDNIDDYRLELLDKIEQDQ